MAASVKRGETKASGDAQSLVDVARLLEVVERECNRKAVGMYFSVERLKTDALGVGFRFTFPGDKEREREYMEFIADKVTQIVERLWAEATEKSLVVHADGTEDVVQGDARGDAAECGKG